MDRRTDQKAYFSIVKHYYISVMLPGFPDEIHKEKPSFSRFGKLLVRDGGTNGWTDQQTYLPVEMQFYISVMFLGLPDDIHEEKSSFLQFKKTH